MRKIILLIVFSAIYFSSCNSVKKQEIVLLQNTSITTNSVRYNGVFVGEILNNKNRKDSIRIALYSDTNSYTLYSTNIQQTGTFTWVNENGSIIELKGLADNYSNRFLVTSNAITQMMDGNIFQDIDGNNQFVLALQ